MEDKKKKEKKPGINENVWSRFDDDGYGIHDIQPPKQKKKTAQKKKKK